MNPRRDCYGCTCVDGYEMDVTGDRYNEGQYGSCV